MEHTSSVQRPALRCLAYAESLPLPALQKQYCATLSIPHGFILETAWAAMELAMRTEDPRAALSLLNSAEGEASVLSQLSNEDPYTRYQAGVLYAFAPAFRARQQQRLLHEPEQNEVRQRLAQTTDRLWKLRPSEERRGLFRRAAAISVMARIALGEGLLLFPASVREQGRFPVYRAPEGHDFYLRRGEDKYPFRVVSKATAPNSENPVVCIALERVIRKVRKVMRQPPPFSKPLEGVVAMVSMNPASNTGLERLFCTNLGRAIIERAAIPDQEPLHE